MESHVEILPIGNPLTITTAGLVDDAKESSIALGDRVITGRIWPWTEELIIVTTHSMLFTIDLFEVL